MKDEYYAKTEAKLYEYYTLEAAIRILKRKNETEKLQEKEQLQKDMNFAMSTLSKENRDFVQHVYGDPESNLNQLCNLFMMSSATFYRRKRQVVKHIALCLGIL